MIRVRKYETVRVQGGLLETPWRLPFITLGSRVTNGPAAEGEKLTVGCSVMSLSTSRSLTNHKKNGDEQVETASFKDHIHANRQSRSRKNCSCKQPRIRVEANTLR